jgi:hypothetical protein
VLTVRTDVTDRMLISSGRPLRSILAEYSASRIEAQVKASGRVLAPTGHRPRARAASMAGRRECVETFAPSPRTDDPGRYKVICSLAGSFGDAQRQGAGIGALTSGPAFGGRTKVA